MARYTAKSIKNVRSGQCIYRVLFQYSFEKGLEYTITPTWFFGRKCLYAFSSEHKVLRIVPQDAFVKREFQLNGNFRRTFGNFLNDALGDAAFTSKRQAQRFCLEVMTGLHPEMVQKMVHEAERVEHLDRRMDNL